MVKLLFIGSIEANQEFYTQFVFCLFYFYFLDVSGQIHKHAQIEACSVIGIDSKYLSTGYSHYTFDSIDYAEAKVEQLLFNKTQTKTNIRKNKKSNGNGK